jgi:hypothetical protein
VAVCSQPGMSSASVTKANGVNANLVRQWVKETDFNAQIELAAAASEAQKVGPVMTPTPTPKFLPMQITTPASPHCSRHSHRTAARRDDRHGASGVILRKVDS